MVLSSQSQGVGLPDMVWRLHNNKAILGGTRWVEVVVGRYLNNRLSVYYNEGPDEDTL